MKLKITLALGIFSLYALATPIAFADPHFIVYITGSSSFRGVVFTTLTNAAFLGSVPTMVASGCSSVGPLDPRTASQMAFYYSNATVNLEIKCNWYGSESGIADLTANRGVTSSRPFLYTGPGFTNQITTNNLFSDDNNTVDMAFSDNDQGVSLNTSPDLSGNAVNVAVIPFVFVKNAQTNGTTLTTAPADWLRLTNVADYQLHVLLAGGSPISLLTANPTDTNWVYMAGRDNQSGAFVNTMLTSGFGLSSSPRQIEIGATNGYARILNGTLITGSGIGVAGQTTGGTLATTMTYVGSSTNLDPVAMQFAVFETNAGWYAIAYLSRADADVVEGRNGAIASPSGAAVELTYNGISETAANVENGKYPFWGNEWLYASAYNLSLTGNYIFEILPSAIEANLDNVDYFSLDSMVASKANSGSDPTHP